jgi:hypothetical protein
MSPSSRLNREWACAALGIEFLVLKGSAVPFPQPKIGEITKKDGQWQLVFDGPNKDSAEAVLGDDYRVISAARVPSSER